MTGRKGDKKTGDQDHEYEGSADANDSECNMRNTGSGDENGTEPSDDEPEDFGSDEGSDGDNTDESSETSSAPQHTRHRPATLKKETKMP